jgi:hypothetical protein
MAPLSPERQGQLAHLAAQAWYLAGECWDHPVVTDNRVWYLGRSARLNDLVFQQDKPPSGPPGYTLTLGELPSWCWEDLASLTGVRIFRKTQIGFMQTRFDILDLDTLDAFEIKPDSPDQIKLGSDDLGIRIKGFNAITEETKEDADRDLDRGARLAKEGWRAKQARRGTRWPRQPVVLPIGPRTWVQVRLEGGTGVLAWKIIEHRVRPEADQPLLENLDELRLFLRDMVQHSQEVLTARAVVLLADVVGSALLTEVTIETSTVAAEAAELEGGPVAAKVAQETIERVAARIMLELAERARVPEPPPEPIKPPFPLGPAVLPVPLPPSLPKGGPGTPQPPVGVFGPAGPMSLQDWFRQLGEAAKGLAEALRVVGDALLQFLDWLGAMYAFPFFGLPEGVVARWLHPQPFFQATRGLKVEEPPAPSLLLAPRQPRPPARRPPRAQPESGGTAPTDEELAAAEDIDRLRALAPYIAAAVPYSAPLNTDTYYLQVDIWSALLAGLASSFGSSAAVLELFGQAGANLDDPFTASQVASEIARRPTAMVAWSVLDWLLFESDDAMADMLAKRAQ